MKDTPNIVVKLVHLKGNIQEFNAERITIGFKPSCHLHFPTDIEVISRNHDKTIRDSIKFKLIDYSSNGTFVNSKVVNEMYLKNGDVSGGRQVRKLTLACKIYVLFVKYYFYLMFTALISWACS